MCRYYFHCVVRLLFVLSVVSMANYRVVTKGTFAIVMGLQVFALTVNQSLFQGQEPVSLEVSNICNEVH